MDLSSAFRVFVRVAETESFSAAAKQLNLGQPAVSKHLRILEQASLVQHTALVGKLQKAKFSMAFANAAVVRSPER